MDMDCCSHMQADQQPSTEFTRQSSIQHLCSHTCQVVHDFGNVYRCLSSGMLHVCDATCASRVYRDPYSSICLISRRIHPPMEHHAQAFVARKRNACQADVESDASKRLTTAQGCVQHMA